MSIDRGAGVDELAELRRRAYGPGAGIADDPDALARLEALERAARASTAGSVSAESPADEADATPLAAEEASAIDEVGAGVAVAPDAATEESPPTPSAAPRPRRPWRSRLPWIVAAVCGVFAIVAVAAATASEFSRPKPELSFGISDEPEEVIRPTLDTPMLDYWGVTNSVLEFRGTVGHLDVWTMAGQEDVVCLFFSRQGDVWGQTCSVRPLSPIIEFRTSIDSIPADSLVPAVPPNSFIRFAWEGDVVNIYIVRFEDEAGASSFLNSSRASWPRLA